MVRWLLWTNRFDAHEWTRTLPETICDGMQLICCPEDLRCGRCTESALQLCEACELPLCRNCLEHMSKQNTCAVPEALANDNWFGYPTELLYTHKVRWIEAAAASPVWTSVINYYLEADRGNLIEEHLHRPEHTGQQSEAMCLPLAFHGKRYLLHWPPRLGRTPLGKSCLTRHMSSKLL